MDGVLWIALGVVVGGTLLLARLTARDPKDVPGGRPTWLGPDEPPGVDGSRPARSGGSGPGPRDWTWPRSRARPGPQRPQPRSSDPP